MKCGDMADEMLLALDLKQSLERTLWSDSGIRGFLIGRVWRDQVYVLNVWTSQSSSKADRNRSISKSSCLTADLAVCQDHLCAGTVIVGVIVVTKSSNNTEAEEYLASLPPEVQKAAPGPLFVVCTIQKAATPDDQSKVTFHRYTAENKSWRSLEEKPVTDDFDAEQVIFRIQARLPMQLQLDNSQPTDIEVWGEKMNKVFSNLEAAVLSGCYMYRFRNTCVFLSESCAIGAKSKTCTVKHLYDTLNADADSPGHKKNASRQAPVLVDLYQKVSGETDHFAWPVCAPAVLARTGSFRFLQLTLPLDVVVEVDGRRKVEGVQEIFSTAVTAQLQAMQNCLTLHRSKENEFYTPEPFHFAIPHRHTCVTVVYPRGITEKNLMKRRQCLHEKMCLGLNKPVFRRANARLFPGQRAEGGYLINPHLGLPPSKVSGGTPHLVQGKYSYHHYMQDRFDDDKWGCAYRSLQTLVSWFRFQGYTDAAVPSHREIQQALVAVGDKESSFVGSKKWIGSFEVSYCLDHLLGVTSKFLNVSAGSELASKGRELAQHFDMEGTPIMIGGGVLAHTILGVDYNEMSGDISFLILDPHYTGGEDLHTIQKEGWCGWKGPDFWNPTAHYNLCMPTRPAGF
ncbi:hypothetical protein ACOMHN_029898 [Nucella lapillus]